MVKAYDNDGLANDLKGEKWLLKVEKIAEWRDFKAKKYIPLKKKEMSDSSSGNSMPKLHP